MTNLNLLYIDNYDFNSFYIKDFSSYALPDLTKFSWLEICLPNYNIITIPFIKNSENLINSFKLNITEEDCLQALPDGFYSFKYYLTTINDKLAPQLFITNKKIFRVNQIQKKLEESFLKLEIGECDSIIKNNTIKELTTINLYIQSCIASSNNCALNQALSLYKKANNMLNKIEKHCNC